MYRTQEYTEADNFCRCGLAKEQSHSLCDKCKDARRIRLKLGRFTPRSELIALEGGSGGAYKGRNGRVLLKATGMS